MQPTTVERRQEEFIALMAQRMGQVARQLSAFVSETPRTLGELEQQTITLVKDLGNALLAGACQLAAPAPAPPQVPCACGQAAAYQRWRPAQVLTVLGPITVQRPYCRCARCRHSPTGRTGSPCRSATTTPTK